MMIAGNSSSYGENTYVILPPYENVTGISFNAWRESASNGTLYFGYITDANDASTFHQLEQLATVYYRDANTTNASFEYNDLSIPSGARLAFRWNHNSSWYSAFIDNVCVKVDAEPAFTKEIIGYGTGTGRWYLITSPLSTAIAPTEVTNMIPATAENYDLYRFNQSTDKEWENWKAQETDHYHFNLENGKGYLYANSENVTLNFVGVPYNGNGQIPLSYDATAQFAGWNLIGNPFGTAATIDRPFYRMNEGGTALSAQVEAGNTVEAMEGVFVQATAEGQSATFTAATRGNAKAAEVLQINVSGNHGEEIDNAIIRFDKGQTLGKFSLHEGSSKVYIPVEGKDLAVAQAEGQVGELPVNFKAETNGTYTLSFTNEVVEFSYLHLIDYMTGDDVDLLTTGASTPSTGSGAGSATYTFQAKTTDYASRFRLVFATGSTVDGDSFGFINGMGNLTIFDIEGEATLQVIDVTGRMLSSETFSGSYEKRLNVAPGIYMLRLINGENVKVQKIVVR